MEAQCHCTPHRAHDGPCEDVKSAQLDARLPPAPICMKLRGRRARAVAAQVPPPAVGELIQRQQRRASKAPRSQLELVLYSSSSDRAKEESVKGTMRLECVDSSGAPCGCNRGQ